LRTFRSLFAALVAAQVAYGKLPEAGGSAPRAGSSG
jgi:hypothetical protein